MARTNMPSLPIRERTVNSQLEKDLRQVGYDPIMAKILGARELGSAQEAKTQGKQLLPWRTMKGAKEAAKILADGIVARQKMVIVADYDSDGATSCAIGMKALASMGANIDFAVPNRFIHGYGLSKTVVDEVWEQKKPEIIITVDNGISSHEGITRAHALGIKVVVTDHHLPGATLPNADCIVNPNQPGCEFPSKNMAGCGVIFYVMAALRDELKSRDRLPEDALNPQELLDYVAIGTIADVVKLDENNRLLARLGLNRIRGGKAHPGVAALFAVARRTMPKATSKDIGFAIGPRINAAGRLEDMSIGIKCLISDNMQEALGLALQLDDLNTKRKNIENNMQADAMAEMWKHEGALPNAIAVYHDSFHEGVIGIVAGRIKEREHRPTVVFAPAQEEGFLKGSGRSIPGFNLKDALDLIHKRNPNLLVKFGGHAMAAGLTINKDGFEEFKIEFEKVAKELLTEEALARFVLTDGDVPGEEMTLDFAERTAAEVWGQGFPEPLYASRFKIRSQQLIKEAHLKMELEKDGFVFSAMWFFRDKVFESSHIDAVYGMEPAEFNKEVFVQLGITQAEEVLNTD